MKNHDDKKEADTKPDIPRRVIAPPAHAHAHGHDDDRPYCSASAEQQAALFAECGRDKVKALPDFRNMLLSQIRVAAKK